MTFEEAIANLNMISVAFVEPVTSEQRKLIDDTFDMAIDALKEKQKTDKIKECFVDGFCAKSTYKKLGKLIADERTNHGQK